MRISAIVRAIGAPFPIFLLYSGSFGNVAHATHEFRHLLVTDGPPECMWPSKTQVRDVALGAGAMYGVLCLLGYAPLWFGPESPRWSKEDLDDDAAGEINRLDRDRRFWKHWPRSSTRNFLEVTASTPQRRIRKWLYFDRHRAILKGVIKFGADVEGPPRCVHGGCSAAVIDACLGILAYKVAFSPCLTANLVVNYKAKIPLGSAVLIECKLDSIDGRKVFLSHKIQELGASESCRVFVEGTALFLKTTLGFVAK